MPPAMQPRPSAETGILTAADVISWRCREANVPVPQLPEAAILTHQSSLLGRRRPWSRDKSLACLSFDVRLLKHGEHAVALAGCRGVGAAATAVVIEELAAVGVRRLLAIDVGGSIEPSCRSGSVMLVSGAIAGDGTSPHYSDAAVVQPDEALTKAFGAAMSEQGIEFTHGQAWTTDAVYRETPSQVAAARADGALIADMETACVLAVSAALGIRAAAVLVAADELFDGWRPPADASRVQTQLKRLLAIAPAVLLQ